MIDQQRNNIFIDFDGTTYADFSLLKQVIKSCHEEMPSATVTLRLRRLGKLGITELNGLLDCHRNVQKQGTVRISLTGLGRGQSLIVIAKLATYFEII